MFIKSLFELIGKDTDLVLIECVHCNSIGKDDLLYLDKNAGVFICESCMKLYDEEGELI